MHKFSEILDSECLFEFYGNDVVYALQMFEIYVGMIEGEIGKLVEATSRLDREQIRKVSHKIKPVFTMIGLPRLSKDSYQIEEQSASGSQEVLDALVDKLKSEVLETLPTINNEITTLKEIT